MIYAFFLICFCSKIIFDHKIFSLCWDKLDYPGSIAYLSCYFRRRRDHTKYDLDQTKIFLYIRRGVLHKTVIGKQFDWTSTTALCELIGQSVAPECHAHLRMIENIQLHRMFEKQASSVWKHLILRICSSQRERERERTNKTKKGQVGSF